MKRWWPWTVAGLLACGLAWAGIPPNVPVLDDPALRNFLTNFLNAFDQSRNRNTTIYCGTSTLSTSMACEEFRGRIPDACTLMRVDATVTTAPIGQAILIDVNDCPDATSTCTSVWNTTQANRLTIADGAKTGSQTLFDTRYINTGHFFGIDVDQVGSGTAGGNLTVTIVCRLGTTELVNQQQ